jgi:hypothetical protein
MAAGYDAAAEDAALAAVIAHGLFSPLAVLSGAAFAVRSFGGALTGAEYEALTSAVLSQSEVLTEGLDSVLRFCSAEFADAAWVIESIGKRYRSADASDHVVLLDQLDSASEVLREGLRALVAGLPSEAIEVLDALRDRRSPAS